MSGFTQACLLFLSEMFAQVEFSHLSRISRDLTQAAAIAVAMLFMTRESKLITGACRHISSTAHMHIPVYKIPPKLDNIIKENS